MSKRLLVLAPHTDDGEFGCGGTLARLVEEGWEAHYVAFSGCKESLPAGLPPDTLVREVRQATAVLGIPAANLTVLDFRVRDFPAKRQEILEYMIDLKVRLDPDLVFLPSLNDTHQDHQQVAQEGFRAFKTTRMLGYEMPWNNLQFATTAFAVLEERHLARKIEAMKCYRSQADRSYANEEFLRSLARTRGSQIGVTYAETFELFRWIL
jgi:LmbE family N-acetylglucosaminyl deacetylase